MSTERETVEDIARIMRSAGLIVGRYEAARALVAAGYGLMAEAWNEGHAAGVWNSAVPRSAEAERKNPHGVHAETCDMGEDCSCRCESAGRFPEYRCVKPAGHDGEHFDGEEPWL